MDNKAAEDDAHVITGSFLVNNVPTFVLFDSGASHSFVSSSHAKSMGLGKFVSVKDEVCIPSGESVSCGKLYKGVSMVIRQVDLPVDLLEFHMDSFEMIAGMDWLDTSIIAPTAAEIPVVGEFPDVFPDEILGLPPKRDYDFSVDLKLGT
ncbi:uncharacterized protein LOC141617340 [Silene latifolia]|uniref:uncharacterized protein LOC141617340 n=1 Tax=Silene latifolia TaxID=37657 RepID=UPI003D774589